MQVDVAVVGGGPAGMTAAARRRAGRRVGRADRRVRRARRADLAAALRRGRRRPLRARCRAPRASSARALAASGVQRARRARPSGPRRSRACCCSPATRGAGRARAPSCSPPGAYDRPVAFPGWTLPGVMTAGGAQALAKGQGVVPGRRVLLAGAGPFLLPVAAQLAACGAEVVARRRGDAPPRLARAPARGWPPIPAGCVDYARYRTRVRRIAWGHVIVRAEGDERVRSATIARGRPGLGARRRASAPSRSTRSAPPTASSRPSTSPARSAASCAATPSRTTTTCARRVPGVFVAGEAAGIGGADLAHVEGELAGRDGRRARRALGQRQRARAAAAQPDLPALRRRRAKLAGFADILADLFDPRPGPARARARRTRSSAAARTSPRARSTPRSPAARPRCRR